jgi:signal transduction histidine kinase
VAIEPQIDGVLLSNFVHQIINPLNGVVGTLDNVLDGTTTGARREQRLKAVRAQLIHSIELIRNLAFLTQLSSGQDPLVPQDKPADVVIPSVVIEAAMFFQEMGNTRGIKIDLTDRTTQYVVEGHRDLLRQVFMNLFDNGIKYSDPDTRITITPHGQRETGNLLVDVESVGEGFEPEEKEHIFDRGYRGAAAKAVKASGTGLGLFIGRRILADAHGATIEAGYSRKTRKSLFRIRFPKYRIQRGQGGI